MLRVRLIHWRAAEAAKYLDLLGAAGHKVEYDERFSPALMRSWRESPPAAFVIDLSRLPSQGREIAIALRQYKATRCTPIVFSQGTDEKIEQTRALFPDAIFCGLPKLKSALRTALANAPKDVVVPDAMMKRYASRSTAQKLGIKAGTAVLLVDPPRDCLAVLGELPPGVEFVEDDRKAAVTICFAHEPHALRLRISELRDVARESKLWICWRKGKSVDGAISERLIRETGITLGLVDYKICSLNEIWSGLLFARKR
jgi:CheY-like chemotaxis protein